jgi:hypothetical protein
VELLEKKTEENKKKKIEITHETYQQIQKDVLSLFKQK